MTAALPGIAIRRYGEVGPHVHVLHGGPGAPGSAAGLAKAIAARFRVSEPLQRRSGEAPLTVAQHVADLDAVIDHDTLLVGWSWGAMLALSYATAHPRHVLGVALIGCGTYDTDSRAVYQRALQARLSHEERREIDALTAAIASPAGTEDRDARFGRLGRIAERAESVDLLDAEEPELRADAQGYRETWADVVRLQETRIEPQSFAAVTAPVVLFQGQHDPHPGRLIFDSLREYVPQLTFVEVPGSGHAPWRERAARERFVSDLKDWLAARA